jgi:hypothetical protein
MFLYRAKTVTGTFRIETLDVHLAPWWEAWFGLIRPSSACQGPTSFIAYEVWWYFILFYFLFQVLFDIWVFPCFSQWWFSHAVVYIRVNSTLLAHRRRRQFQHFSSMEFDKATKCVDNLLKLKFARNQTWNNWSPNNSATEWQNDSRTESLKWGIFVFPR